LLSVSSDKSAKLWDRTFAEPFDVNSEEYEPLSGMAFLEGGRLLITASQFFRIIIRNSISLEIDEEIPSPQNIQGFECTSDVSPDGRIWVVTEYDSSVTVVESQQLVVLRPPNLRMANKCAHWSPSGSRIITSGDGGPIVVHDWRLQGNVVAIYGESNKDWVNDAFFTSDEKAIIGCSQKSMNYYEIGDPSEKLTRPTRVILPEGVSMARLDALNSRYVAVTMTGNGYKSKPKGVVIGYLHESKFFEVIDPNCGNKKHLCLWTPCARYVLLTTKIEDGLFGCPVLSVVDASDGKCIVRFCSPFPSNFTHIACTCVDRTIRIALADDSGKIFMLKLMGGEIP
jgi:WD40 repeat protein